MALLRELPRKRDHQAAAREKVANFRSAHPGIAVDLLIDQPPGSPQADYDLLLADPEGGTIGLSWRADEGVPWVVNYAEHWAANCVASIGGHHLEVQDALLFLKMARPEAPNLMDDLMEQLILSHAIEQDPPAVENAELQDAAQRFRIIRRLSSDGKMQEWLAEHGLSLTAFENMMRAQVQATKFKRQITDGCIASYFADHLHDFDIVQTFRAEVPTEIAACKLANTGRERGLLVAVQDYLASAHACHVEGSLLRQRAYRLPASLASAAHLDIVGPFVDGPLYVVAQVLLRQSTELNWETCEAVREKLFREWLLERRREVNCRWHWM